MFIESLQSRVAGNLFGREALDCAMKFHHAENQHSHFAGQGQVLTDHAEPLDRREFHPDNIDFQFYPGKIGS